MNIKARFNLFCKKIRTLQGDPHYIALGMAVGVFTGITPTVPFQTVIAVTLAFILNASKPAAVIGTFTANPITLPVYYTGSYKIGKSLLGSSIPGDIHFESVAELLRLGTDVTLALMTGGVLMGVLPAIATYLITRKFFQTIRARFDTGEVEPAMVRAGDSACGSAGEIPCERGGGRLQTETGAEEDNPDKRMRPETEKRMEP